MFVNNIEGNDAANSLYAYRLSGTTDNLYGSPFYFITTPGPRDGTEERLLDYASYGFYTGEISTGVLPYIQLKPTQGDTLIGNGGDDRLFGDLNNDTLVGGAGNDLLYGFGGLDIMIGGAGDDTYIVDQSYQFAQGYADVSISYVDESVDQLIETADGGIDTIKANVNFTLGEYFENLTLLNDTAEFDQDKAFYSRAIRYGHQAQIGIGNSLDNKIIGNDHGDQLFGMAGSDILQGGVSADRLDGGSGADIMTGGSGYDTYVVENIGDQVIETEPGNWPGGFDTVESSITYTLGSYVENLTLVGNDILNGTGNELNNQIIGNSAANQLVGGVGDDELTGGAGDDVTMGGIGSDTYRVSNGSGKDLIIEQADTAGVNDRIVFESGIVRNDVSFARGGENLLVGWRGGLDNVTIQDFFVSDAQKVETFEFADGTIVTAAQAALLVNSPSIPSAITGTSGNDTLTGTNADNLMRGLAGNDTLTGLAGNDTLDGGAGTDTMRGGIGNDTYIVDVSTDVVTENANEGTDTVQSTITYTLGTNVENLTLTGTAAINGTGNTLANMLTGNSANNTLNGGTGADTLQGGAGNDTYVIDNIGDVITENATEGTDTVQTGITYTLGTNVENLTLTGSSAINGSGNELNNILTGNAGVNSLYGYAGDDTLNGGTGADKLFGGAGNDNYVVDNTGDVLTENANEGTDSVQSSITHTLGANIENLTLTGTSAINGTGNTLDNIIIGNSAVNTLNGGAGNDSLDGAAGADTMAGGAGDDIYVVDNTADKVTESAGAGTDTVQSRITHTLGTNIEALILTGTSAINGTDNTLNNLLTGNSAVNTLTAGTGNDILQGNSGNDILKDTAGNNLLSGGVGTDTLTGASGHELFIGGSGNDTITTGTGADIVAFNRGDGVDTVAISSGQDNTLSLGGGIRNTDLVFRKSNNNLILDTGNSESIVLKDWYVATTNKSVLTLQMIEEASIDFAPGGGNSLTDNKVEQFNFAGLVNQFDQARLANPALTSWALSNALLDFHLSGSDSAAIGGDLSYQYGKNNSISGIGLDAAQTVMNDPQFGSAPQGLQPLATLQQGAVKL